MRYVDEFRDRGKAERLVKEIETLAAALDRPADAPLHIMEVCGGHTHSIFRYGLEGMLPPSIELVIREPEGRARCLDCGRELATPSLTTPCGCGSRRLQRLAGEELLVKTMELAEAA